MADSLRFRDLSNNLLWLNEKGLVTNVNPAISQDLILTGYLDASAAYIRTLDVSFCVISYLDASEAVINALTVTNLDASEAVISSLDVTYMDASNADIFSASINTVDISNATVNHADISSAVIDYLPQFDPAGNIFPILPFFATLPQLIASYNQLITLFASRNIFLSLPIPPVLLFQTPCEIHIAEFPTVSPNIRIDFTYSQPIQLGVAADSIVATLNQTASNAGAKLRFFFDGATSKVAYHEEAGYSWIFTDPMHYGSANRFLNHLGITGLIPSENGVFVVYNSGIGSIISNLTGGSPGTPAAPPAPTLSGVATAHAFTITIPTQSADVKKIGIFLDHGTGSIHSWDLISSPASSYTFSNLVPETTYLVHLTFLSDFDESPLSPALSVTTSASVALSFNVLTAAATTLTPPSLNATYNNVIFVVAQTTAAVWSQMSTLLTVSQISSIELQYYSGFDEAPRNYDIFVNDNGPNIQDARLMFYPNPSSPQPPVSDGVVLYYSGPSRMAVTGPGNEDYAIGSSNPPNTSTDPPAPAASVFISDQNTLQYMFGQGTDTIDTTKGFQFAWFCGYADSLIQNMNISKFIINYME